MRNVLRHAFASLLLASSVIFAANACSSTPSPVTKAQESRSMEPENVISYGLSLTHNCLRVHKAADLIEFYSQKFGMKLLGELTSQDGEQFFYLGFSDYPGVLWNPEKTYLELRQSRNIENPIPYKPSRTEVYWKIGITTPDVNHVASVLRAQGVHVSDGSQFEDIGFLTHLNDPEGFGIELLQHDFQNNFRQSPPNPNLALGFPLAMGQITLRIADAEASLSFYRDLLGMKLLSRQEVTQYGFVLYFLAWTEDNPPNQDVNAVENREWLWKRPYTTLELQHISGHAPYRALPPNQAGFLGLRVHSPRVRLLKSHLESKGVAVTDAVTDHDPIGLPAFTVHDPDGVPVTVNQVALF